MDNDKKTAQRESFSSRFAFIMTLAGFSIGIGNLWKFPYMVGENGGGAFLFVYLILVVILGIPLFIIETTIGRATKSSPIQAMHKLAGKKSKWQAIGWCGIIALFLLTSYSIMIVGGWALGYFFKILSGSLNGLSPEMIEAEFNTFIANPVIFLFEIALVAVIGIVISRGLKNGVERVCKILMPILFVTLIALAVYSLTLDGAMEGLIWYIKPDFSKINMSVILAASSQVFLSIGIGMGVAFVYGSYLSDKENIPGNVTITTLTDTCGAVLSGLVLVPALYAFAIEPTIGPTLLFVTLPNLFVSMPGGSIFGAAFFGLVVVAGFTTIIGQVEALVRTLMDMSNYSRQKALVIVLAALFLMNIPITLGFGPLSFVTIFGMGIFDFVDFIGAYIILNLGAILMTLFVAFQWKFENLQKAANVGSGKFKITNAMKPLFVIVAPIAVTVIVISMIWPYLPFGS